MPFGRRAKSKTPLDEAALYDYAVKALARHMRTETELRRLLSVRAEPGARGEAAIRAVVARLKEQHYLDDRSYAETFTRLRQENDKLGARRVRQTLSQRGIAPEIVERAVRARYDGANEEALARQHLDRKHIPRPESREAAARVVRRLVAAGFSTGVICKILRQWDVPEEELAALDEFESEPRQE
jgi:regulatory protein